MFLLGLWTPTAKPPTKKEVYHTTKSLPWRPPHFADARSKKLTYAMLNAEAHVAPRQIKIQGEGGAATIYWNGSQLRQDSATGSWSFGHGTLAVATKSGFYKGTANRSDALDYLAALTGGADTFARQLLFRQKPFADFLGPDETVRLVGNVTLAGTPTYILSINGRAIRGSLNIRKSDDLVIAAEAATLSPTGAEVYRAQRTYQYLTLPSTKIFKLKPKNGQHVKPLPKSAIKIGKHLVK
jgi:hypothetical protein